ncbi:hypothetical protein ZIOFF_029141 [Zingiber officinale]|uniref:DUF4216 domain-containing protein n=1 Tax=Zingiber officinale TaxID=94328 RepID=A0A8J5GT86_ZINOF|nr:hypothetical protein ZIOFF_029141 [Zingiber officinale]
MGTYESEQRMEQGHEATRCAKVHLVLDRRPMMTIDSEIKNELKRRHRYGQRPSNSQLDDMVRMQFPEWFARRVESETNKKVQNSGVMVQAMHDNDDHESIYYGRLTDVISLDYGGRGRIVLFRCDWVNTTTGFKIDPFGFSMLNFSRLIHTGECEEHEPFILATQAQMVYYVRDPKEEDWYCAIRHTPRDTYNMGNEDDMDTMHFIHNNFSNMESILGDVNRVDVELIRTDVEGSIVDVLLVVNNETDDESFS